MEYVLEAIGVEKRFGALIANHGINLSVRRGEIHAIMGENGAGKSTLMAMLFGMLSPSAGTIKLRGRAVAFSSPLDAIAAGIGMVHQAFKLFPSMTVWQNIVFGSEPARIGTIDKSAAHARIRELSAAHSLQIDPDAIVADLPIGLQQRVEILKALYREADILILDEPTAVLSPGERDGLLKIMRDLADKGKTLLFVTHKLNEIMAVSDTVTIMRKGQVVDVMATRETTSEKIVEAMTGRSVNASLPRQHMEAGKALLEVFDLVRTDAGKPILTGVTLDVRAGEIVGIAGVAGNGQNELIAAITGRGPIDSGDIKVAGVSTRKMTVRQLRRLGLSFVPEDRHAVGSASSMPAFVNLALGKHRQDPMAKRCLIDTGAMRAYAEVLIKRFGVSIHSADTKVGTLSGGNLQKLIVAREVAHEADVLIIEQPTRGVDVGAIELIHQVLLQERMMGRAILLVSSELSELLALCDRILVMYEGRIVAELPAEKASEQEIGYFMAGGRAVV
ncbi:ABC transporter ATP-binding protein [uncultured Agrobacterium sp.]|uniref:ABC transporter ATP-binding protein n=1 Tax=uncultured Agrobacterium sp. TaxID=157277 RepID=UPI0025E6901B|nr:ABC transporter ATP-binding protein [uncultured Agrobacterium sp.]